MKSLRRRLPLRSLALPVFAAIAICCSNAIATAASSQTDGPSAANGRAVVDSLSGTWSGKYGGTYHGTFILHWTQTASRLRGTLKLSTASARNTVTGTVSGRTIRFGTVSGGITYTGSVSGKSMSGHYQTPGGGGSWSAHKTS
jgi:uncharacterized protein YukE